MGHRAISRQSVLCFRGPDTGDKVVLPHQERFNFTGPFSVAVWFKVERFTGKYQTLIAKGAYSWRLQQDVGRNMLAFDTNPKRGEFPAGFHKVSGRTDVADGRWHLAAAVYEPAGAVARKRLYIDGRLDAEGETRMPIYDNGEPVWLGNDSMETTYEIQGWIDEVAIFARALSPDEVTAMFHAGNPSDPQLGKEVPHE